MSEKQVFSEEKRSSGSDEEVGVGIGEVHHIVNIEELEAVPTFWLKFTQWTEKAGAETIGVQRLPEEARDPSLRPWSTFFIWTTSNLHYSAITTGALGPTLWDLGWWDSFLCLLFFNAIGCATAGATSMIGPQLGMRTMIVGRYSYGYWFNKLTTLFTVITCLGWTTINTVAGGNLLLDAWDNKVPLVVVISMIMALSTMAVFFGYAFIEKADRYGWILQFVAFIFLVGFGGKHFTYIPMSTGSVARLGCLSYGALIFSWSVAWAPLAADYSSYLPEKTSKRSVFLWTFLGNFWSSTTAFMIGIALASLTHNPDPVHNFAAAYKSGGYGALTGAIFLGSGTGVRNFGRFVQTMMGMGIVGANVPNMYSFGLDVQAVSSYLRKIPRTLVTIFGGLAAMAISLALRDNFVEALENFMDLFGYWVTPFVSVIIIEHFFIRKRYVQYDFDAWDSPSKLPVGLAGGASFLMGFAIALLCADQTWLVGPIASAFGGYGADIAFECAFATVLVTYIPLRILELKHFKRSYVTAS